MTRKIPNPLDRQAESAGGNRVPEFQLLALNPPPKRLARLLHNLELKTIGSREVLVDIPELGLTYAVTTNSLIGRLLRQNGMYEEHIVNWITKRFPAGSGGNFIDVGANFGWYSCLFSRIAGETGKVFLFEPEKANIDLLTRNLTQNGAHNFKLFQAAAGSQAAIGVLHKAHHSNPGAHTMVDGLYSEGEVSVPIVTLDEAVLPLLGDKRISLLKMDIEGFELEALRGAQGILERTDAMVIEFTPHLLTTGGYDPAQLWRLMSDFDAFRFDYTKGPVPISQQPDDTCDLLLLRPIARVKKVKQ